MIAGGVLSSCDASATNRRWAAIDRRIGTRASPVTSIVTIAAPNRPTTPTRAIAATRLFDCWSWSVITKPPWTYPIGGLPGDGTTGSVSSLTSTPRRPPSEGRGRSRRPRRRQPGSGRPGRLTRDGFAISRPVASRYRSSVSADAGDASSDSPDPSPLGSSPSSRVTAASTVEASARSTSRSSARSPTKAVAAPITTISVATSASVVTNRRRRVAPSSRAVGSVIGVRSGLRAERVAHAAHRPEPVRPPELAELAAKVMDIQVDDVRVDVRLRAPHRIEDLLSREDLAGMADEEAEQCELARRQVDRPVTDLGDVTELVEAQVAGLERSLGRTRRSPARGH